MKRRVTFLSLARHLQKLGPDGSLLWAPVCWTYCRPLASSLRRTHPSTWRPMTQPAHPSVAINLTHPSSAGTGTRWRQRLRVFVGQDLERGHVSTSSHVLVPGLLAVTIPPSDFFSGIVSSSSTAQSDRRRSRGRTHAARQRAPRSDPHSFTLCYSNSTCFFSCSRVSSLFPQLTAMSSSGTTASQQTVPCHNSARATHTGSAASSTTRTTTHSSSPPVSAFSKQPLMNPYRFCHTRHRLLRQFV